MFLCAASSPVVIQGCKLSRPNAFLMDYTPEKFEIKGVQISKQICPFVPSSQNDAKRDRTKVHSFLSHCCT
jgi:hypothetical protein